MKAQSFCFVLAIVALCFAGVYSNCTLRTDQNIGTHSPLLIANATFIYPDRNNPKTLNFRTNVYYQSYCLGSSETAVNGHKTGSHNIPLQCISNTKFKAPLDFVDFKDITCTKISEPMLVTRNPCKNGKFVDIGFKANTYVSLIDICYNADRGQPNWAHAVVIGAIAGRQTLRFPPHPPPFNVSKFFPKVPVGPAFTRVYQRIFLFKLFDHKETLVNKYIPATGDHFFTAGHLIPPSYQYYTAQQYATYYYVNALPTWHIINYGNWALVSDSIANLAGKNGDIDVWSGGLGGLELPYTETEKRLIYLAKNGTTLALVVPKLLFKVVYHRDSQRAVVYITVNNPYVASTNPLPEEYQVCKEYAACREADNRFNNVEHGYTYCCLWNDFTQNTLVSGLGLPDIGNTLPLI